MLTSNFHGSSTHRHRGQVLRPRRTNSGDVAHHQRHEIRASIWFSGGERLFIGDDRAVVVTHRVVDGGDRVVDVSGIDAVAGRPVQVKRPQATFERFREVRRLVVNDTEQVHGPRFNQLSVALGGDFTGFHRQSEGILRITTGVGEAGKSVQRFRFTDAITIGTRHNPRLDRQLSGCPWVLILFVRCSLEQVPYGRGRARLGRRNGIRFHVG